MAELAVGVSRDAAASRPGLYPHAPWYLLAALAVAVAGFAPSFFLRLHQTDWSHHLHGISAFGWMTLLVVQAWLIRTGRRPLHRALGRWSWILVVLLVAGGVLMLRHMLAPTAGPFGQRFGPMLAFIDVTTLAYFVCAYALALVYRRSLHLHARLMVSTVVLVLPPALARLLPNVVPGIDTFMAALHAAQACTELVVVALIVHDVRRWKPYPPYPALLALLVAQHASMQWIAAQPAWLAFCRWLGA